MEVLDRVRAEYRMGFLIVVVFVLLPFALGIFQDDPATRKVYPQGEVGFAWPYYLYVPSSMNKETVKTILVYPGNVSTRVRFGIEEEESRRRAAFIRRIADALDTPVLVPDFPKEEGFEGMGLPTLDDRALQTESKDVVRLDVQLLAMLEHARRTLLEESIATHPQVILFGMDAEGVFAHRFALLHPTRVKSLVAESVAGFVTLPITHFGTEPIPYPVGVSNLDVLVGYAFDKKSFLETPMLLLMKENDPVDSLSDSTMYAPWQQTKISSLFGRAPMERWIAVGDLYEDLGSRASWVLYQDTGDALMEEVIQFFQEQGSRQED